MPFQLLISYHYYKTVDLDAMVSRMPTKPEVFADSGAFSAYWQGADITVADYSRWLRRWAHLWTTYVSLDAIGDAATSLRNYQAMRDDGLDPVPVFHGGEPWEYLDRYCAAHPYVALGGMVASSKPAIMRWLVQAFRVGQAAGTVFHGFGQTTYQFVTNFPWYSVDSSSWGSGHRFGTLHLWDGTKGRFAHVAISNARQVYAAGALIREHGGDPVLLATKGFGQAAGKDKGVGQAERGHVIAVNVAAWLRFEAWLRARHGEIPGPAGRTPGPKLYFAEGAARNLELAAAAAHTLEVA